MRLKKMQFLGAIKKVASLVLWRQKSQKLPKFDETNLHVPKITRNPNLIADRSSSLSGLSAHTLCLITYLAPQKSYKSLIMPAGPFHTHKSTVTVATCPK